MTMSANGDAARPGMDREAAREFIIKHPGRILTRDKSGKGYVCPICGSGTGKNGTGITTKDGVHFTCWGRGNCYVNADIIDIIGKQYGLTDYPAKLGKAAELYGLEISGAGSGQQDSQPKADRIQPEGNQREEDYRPFFLQANKNIGKTDYHRGISLETLNRFWIGYAENWRNPKAPNAPSSPRLIIPTSAHSYLARDTRNNLSPEQEKYKKLKVGKVRIFNSEELERAGGPVFVAEGELDALSIIDAGGAAIGLGSASNRRLLLELLEKNKPGRPFVLALDNDWAGEAANRDLEAGLERLGIPFIKYNVAGSAYKDANEALMHDREGFTRRVKEAANEAERAVQGAPETERAALEHESALYSLPGFLEGIKSDRAGAFIPTGFQNLDALLDGGLYPGLYIVGAISSLGKTTFCLQMADQIAAAGHDVLVFTLEMSSRELMGKSISRLTYQCNDGDGKNAKTARGILTGALYARYNREELALIDRAVESYKASAEHLYITEGVGNVGINEISGRIARHISVTGRAPVVVIDYLQIIAPADPRATDKQNTDKAVLELKRMSRDYKIPIIGISSFNRENYTAPVNLTSFKESGAIEYCSDVLIGLQYEGMDYSEGETDKEREKRIRGQIQEEERAGLELPRHIQLKILKNRNGRKGDALFNYYSAFNCYEAKGNAGGLPGTLGELAGDSEGWIVTASTDSPKAGRKKNKREEKREALGNAFNQARGDGFTAPLMAIADIMGKSKRQIINMIDDLGGYTVEGEEVASVLADENNPFI